MASFLPNGHKMAPCSIDQQSCLQCHASCIAQIVFSSFANSRPIVLPVLVVGFLQCHPIEYAIERLIISLGQHGTMGMG